MKIALLFPGYGSQFVGMAKELYDESRIMQEYFEEACNCLNNNFIKLCFASSDAELCKMANAYPALFLVSSSLFALLKEEGIVPHVVAGHNLGEYSAIFAAQGINHPDGLYLLNKFATVYQEAAAAMDIGALHVKGLDTATLTALCMQASKDEDIVQIALYNTDHDHVVTGHSKAIALLKEQVNRQTDGKAVETSIEVGMHSALMEPVAQQLAMYLEKIDFKDLTIPLISGMDGNSITTGQEVRERVLSLLHKPVLWRAVMEQLHDADIIVEVGPGTALSTMVKNKYPDKIIMSVNKRADVEELKKVLGIGIEPPQPTESINGNI